LNGSFKKYDDGGLLIYETSYYDDEISDDVKMYYENGSPLVIFKYAFGSLNGETVGYYRDGGKFYSAKFRNNLRDGWQKYFYENGSLASESYYDNGFWNEKDYREYDEKGKIRIKIENKGYGTKYLRYDEDGVATPMSEDEKAALLKRINQRDQEQKIAEVMSRKSPQIRKLF